MSFPAITSNDPSQDYYCPNCGSHSWFPFDEEEPYCGECMNQKRISLW